MSDQRHTNLGLQGMSLGEDGHPHRRKTLRRALWVLLVVGVILVLAGTAALFLR